MPRRKPWWLPVALTVTMFIAVVTPACDKNQLREARKATDRIEIVSSSAIDTIIAFKAEGAISTDQEKALARILLEINGDDRALIVAVSNATVWDANTKAAVIAQLQTIVDAVVALQTAGGLHITNPSAVTRFTAIVTALKSALAVLEGLVN